MSTTLSPSTALSPSTDGSAADTAADPGARIDALRGEIDACDAEIIALVRRRLSISQEIGSLRTASGGMRLSLSREQRVLARFRDALGPDGSTLGMMLLRQGRGRL
ncbi:chorismate mutase [Modestobacter sp. VKM Ac-2985]|uniref:chorismate mutase n=1 Tax=Modestobacter sp. VKM Ac-2985 TaxID=3004139 RepID=UPI0022AB9B04|nr:chorismate mutase [Modestobacter sp. VKM Ac-2985]MCZ2838505.1 chorismate mutase [Modestobacter sp. VKM Ac-2985]